VQAKVFFYQNGRFDVRLEAFFTKMPLTALCKNIYLQKTKFTNYNIYMELTGELTCPYWEWE
jgi:hypothetical protein